LRGLWAARSNGSLIYSRRFPTVERRVKRRNRDGYKAIPGDGKFLRDIESDVFGNESTGPLITSKSGWSIVFVKQGNIVMFSVPEIGTDFRDPGITLIISLMQELISHLKHSLASSSIDVIIFDRLLTTAFPFGRCLSITVDKAGKSRYISPIQHDTPTPTSPWGWDSGRAEEKEKNKKRPIVTSSMVEVLNAVYFGPKSKHNQVVVSGMVHIQAVLSERYTLRLHIPKEDVQDVKTTTLTDYDTATSDIRAILGPKNAAPVSSAKDGLVLCTYVAARPGICFQASYKILNSSLKGFVAEIWLKFPPGAYVEDFEAIIPLSQVSFVSFHVIDRNERNGVVLGPEQSGKRHRSAVWRPFERKSSVHIPTGDRRYSASWTRVLKFQVRLGQGEVGQERLNGKAHPVDLPTSFVTLSWREHRAMSNVKLEFLNDDLQFRVSQSSRTENFILADRDYYSGSAHGISLV